MERKRYFLRGGIIGFIVSWALIFFNLFNTLDGGYGRYLSRKFSELIIFLPQGDVPANPSFYQNYWYLVPIIFYTIIGIVLGVFYGKIKNRNTN